MSELSLITKTCDLRMLLTPEVDLVTAEDTIDVPKCCKHRWIVMAVWCLANDLRDEAVILEHSV